MATNEPIKDQTLLNEGHHDDLLQEDGECGGGDEEEEDEAEEDGEGKEQFIDNNNKNKFMSKTIKLEPEHDGGDIVHDVYDGREIGSNFEAEGLDYKDDEKLNNNNKFDQVEDETKNSSSNSNSNQSSAIPNNQVKKEKVEEDDDLEEGELKDDDDDYDDEEDEADNNTEEQSRKRLNTGYNNNDNNSGLSKESSSFYSKSNRHDQQNMNYPPHHQLYHPNRRQQQLSPNSQAEMHSHHHQYPSNHLPSMPSHHFSHSNINNNNHYRYPPNDGPPHPASAPHHMNHQPGSMTSAGVMYPRGVPPGNVGPMHKVNVRCRFYSKLDNKCTWGDHCRFEHRDDSPNPADFDPRPPPPGGLPGSNIGTSRGPMGSAPMGAAERVGAPTYPSYSSSGSSRHHQPPYPAPQSHGPGYPSPYDAYGHPHPHHSRSPPLPLPPHQQQQWSRQQQSPYPSPSSSSAAATAAHPPESVSPVMQPTSGGPTSGSVGRPSQPPGSSGGSGSSGGGASVPPVQAGATSPVGGSFPSPSSSSAVVYERKHRLAYESAPWNDRGGVYPSVSKYERGVDPNVGPYPHMGRGYYRNHNYSGSREPPPYGRDPYLGGSHLGGPYPGYNPNYPSSYRGGSSGPHPSHHHYPHHQSFSKYNNMSSSQRIVPPDPRRSRKRGHDEDESSWSDSGSDDSILGQAKNYGGRPTGSHASKHTTAPNRGGSSNKHPQHGSDNIGSLEEQLEEQGSGTPPGEPLEPEDPERESLLNKLKEIEDLMAKKKAEQEDPM